MIAAVPKEILPLEKRVSATPSTVKGLTKAGITVQVEKDAGLKSYISDSHYKEAGAQIIESAAALYSNADIILKVQSPGIEEISQFKPGAVSVSLLQTTRAPNFVKAMAAVPVTGFSMHLIPRTTLAQKMDALSSQANIAGYKAVLMGAGRLGIYMPLLMTAAGTVRPAKVLVLGAGVAGLQAVATAKRLGAQVEAFDVRPIVKEQVESLGAKFIEVETNDNDGVGEGGYAKETSEDYKQRQQELIHEHITKADLVVTTALIPGRPAPLLIPESMVDAMQPGSVIMDLAAENGGNCALTRKDQIVEHKQVTIDGTSNIPATMPVHASDLYAKNVTAFVTYMIKNGKLDLDLEDEIISGALFTHNGEITHEPTQEAVYHSRES